MADTEINLAQLKEYKAGEYQLIDIRNEDAFRCLLYTSPSPRDA